MIIENKSHFTSTILSLETFNKRQKKSILKLSGVSLNALLLAGCGSNTSPPPVPQQPLVLVDFTQTGNTFTATSNSDVTLSEGSSSTDLTVTSGGGDDSLTTGSGADIITSGAGNDTIVAGGGNDIIHAGDGSDTVQGGDGNDTIILVGTTTAGQYSASSITNSAGGADMSSVLTTADLNNNTVSEVGAGEVIDGGTGNDSLVIYGTAYINQATLLNLNEMWVNSEVILTGEQFSLFGSFKGDGASVLRVRSDDLEAVTAENDDTPGGNKGHGNNTDGQDDNNPGQGSGGPNFRDKDGIDEDEAGGGTSGGSTTTGDGTTSVIEPTIVDISSIYMGGIGTLSLEGNITLLADDMHDFAGITNVNGDGTTNIILNGDADVTITEFDLSAVNLSGIAELELNGNFNLIVRSANDYFGIGSIAVSGLADITLTIDSSTNVGFTAAYDFTQSPLAAVDTVKVYGDTKLTFNNVEQLATTKIIGVTDSLTIAFTGAADGTATDILISSLDGILFGVDALELGANLSLTLDDQAIYTSIGAPSITGTGTVIIDRAGMDDAALETYLTNMGFGADVTILDTNGVDLRPLIPATLITGNAGDDTYVGEVGETIYVFEPVNGNFGYDTIEGFELTQDKINIAATGLNFNELEQSVTSGGLQIITPQGWILVTGLMAPLTADSFILYDTTGPSISNVTLSHSVDMDVDQFVHISISASDADSSIASAIATFSTPSGGTLEIDLGVGGASNTFSGTFDKTIFTEEGTYTLSLITVTDVNGNVTTSSSGSLTGTAEPDATVTVFNSQATNASDVISGTSAGESLIGTSGNDIFVGRGGDDTLTGAGGNDIYAYLSGSYVVDPDSGTTVFDTNFGVDTITDFNEGDRLDFSATNWSFGNVKIYYRGSSTEIIIGENKVVLDGFTGVLTNIGTYDDPVLVVMSEADRLDANHEGDVRPPSVDGITVPATVNLDESVRFYFDLDVSDDISGVDYIYFQYRHADGHYFYMHTYASDAFEGWATLNEWFAPGTYTLTNIQGRDNQDNYFNYSAGDIEALGLTSNIEITNSNPDLVDPVVTSVTLSQTTLDLTTDDEIFVTLEATDDLSGLDYVWVRFRGPDGDYFDTYFYPESGLVTKMNINPYFTSGTYEIWQIWGRDNAGNTLSMSGQTLTDAGFNQSFELINPNADDEAPTLTSVTSNDNLVYVIGVDDQLIIDTLTADNLAGTHYNYLQFTNGDGYSKWLYDYNAHYNNQDLLNYDAPDLFSYTLNADLWPEGTYTLTTAQLYGYDKHWNTYNTEDLAAAQVSFSFDVVAPLKINGTVEDDLLIGGDGYDHFVMGANFGTDTIESFTLGEDYVDLRATTLGYGEINQTVTADGLLIEANTDSVLVKGLTEILSDEFLLANGGSNSNLIPTLTGIALTNNNIDATDGANIDITITVEDPSTDLDYGYLRFLAPDGSYIYHYLNNNADLIISEWLSEWSDAGVYALDYVYLRDSNGISTSYNSTQLTDLGLATSYTVVNATEDLIDPTLTNFTISDTTIEVGIENVLNFTASGDDTDSGIARFEVNYSTSTGNRGVSLDSEHQFIGGTSFSDWSTAGTYSINYIYVFDNAGNSTMYDTAALDGMGFQTTFDVTNTNEDTVAPVLTGLTLDQAYLDSDDTHNDSLVANIAIDETGSGLSYFYIHATNEAGQAFSTSSSSSLATIMPGANNPGIYTLTQVTLKDLAGNTTTYDATQLTNMGFNLTYRVLGDGAQPGVAVDGTAGIDNIIGTTDDEVFTLRLGTDTVSFDANWGHDTIADFIQGDDVLDFSGSGLTYADLTINDTSFGLFINDANGNDLLLQGFHGELQAGDAIFATTNGSFDADTMTAGPLETIDAGPGDDVITITDDNFNSINGGAGIDTLVISGDGLDGIDGLIDLSGLIARGAVLNFEGIDISNPDIDDTLLLTADQVIAMTDANNILVIDGDAGDTLSSQGEGWIANGTTIINGVEYDVYTSEDAIIHVNPDMGLLIG